MGRKKTVRPNDSVEFLPLRKCEKCNSRFDKTNDGCIQCQLLFYENIILTENNGCNKKTEALARTYDISCERAIELWDKIVEQYGEEYIASIGRIFYTLPEKLTYQDAAKLIYADPKRLTLLFMNTYTCNSNSTGIFLKSLVYGFMQANMREQAFESIELYLEKYKDADERQNTYFKFGISNLFTFISSNYKHNIPLSRKSVLEVCNKYINNDNPWLSSHALITSIDNNTDTDTILSAIKACKDNAIYNYYIPLIMNLQNRVEDEYIIRDWEQLINETPYGTPLFNNGLTLNEKNSGWISNLILQSKIIMHSCFQKFPYLRNTLASTVRKYAFDNMGNTLKKYLLVDDMNDYIMDNLQAMVKNYVQYKESGIPIRIGSISEDTLFITDENVSEIIDIFNELSNECEHYKNDYKHFVQKLTVAKNLKSDVFNKLIHETINDFVESANALIHDLSAEEKKHCSKEIAEVTDKLNDLQDNEKFNI